jgi:glycopeptide antibiotics resistance protein
MLRYLSLAPLLVLGVMILLAAVVIALVSHRWSGLTRTMRTSGTVLVIGTVLAILILTFGDKGYGGGVVGVNLVPLRGIYGELHNANREIGFANVLGNIFMFVPLGVFLPMVVTWRWREIVLAGALFSALIEVLQFVAGRSADIDDVILNTAGAAIGAGVVLVTRNKLELRRMKLGTRLD